MAIRNEVVAGAFYRGDKKGCLKETELYIQKKPFTLELPSKICAGIVPHAGWLFSGATAGMVFRAIKEKANPKNFVLFGAVHTWGVEGPCIFSKGSWKTPLGKIEINEELSGLILSNLGDLVRDDPSPHNQEHSIEVQVPFIQYLFPEAKIVPIMISPDNRASEVGKGIAGIVKDFKEETVAIGTTDLTHYGPRYGFAPQGVGKTALNWVKSTNDKKIIDLMIGMECDKIIPEARNSQNACGAGAATATCAYAETLGVEKGTLLDYTTSYDVMQEGSPTDFVGYTGIVF